MTTTTHPYAHILHAIADGQPIQFRYTVGPTLRPWNDAIDASDALQRVLNVSRQETGYNEYEFRVKPRTITINGHEVPEPARVAPEPDEPFWLPAILSGDSETTSARRWTGTRGCYRWLQQGLIHLTKEAASAHAAALISFTDATTP